MKDCFAIVTALALCTCTLGCSGGSDEFDTVSVSGKVYVDGAVHSSGSLQLYPISGPDEVKPSVAGVIGSDGSFTLTTYSEGDGAPPGEYSASLAAGGGGGVDPSAMMSSMSGAPQVDSVTITIPEDGSDSLDINFVSSAGGAGGAGDGTGGGDTNTLLGSP